MHIMMKPTLIVSICALAFAGQAKPYALCGYEIGQRIDVNAMKVAFGNDARLHGRTGVERQVGTSNGVSTFFRMDGEDRRYDRIVFSDAKTTPAVTLFMGKVKDAESGIVGTVIIETTDAGPECGVIKKLGIRFDRMFESEKDADAALTDYLLDYQKVDDARTFIHDGKRGDGSLWRTFRCCYPENPATAEKLKSSGTVGYDIEGTILEHRNGSGLPWKIAKNRTLYTASLRISTPAYKR